MRVCEGEKLSCFRSNAPGKALEFRKQIESEGSGDFTASDERLDSWKNSFVVGQLTISGEALYADKGAIPDS